MRSGNRVSHRRLLGLIVAIALTGGVSKSFAAANIEQLARECNAGKAKSCAKLSEAAKSEKNYPALRLEAVKALTNQDVLADIAKTDNSADRRLAAVNGINQPPLLLDVATHAVSVDAQIASVSKITDQPTLAGLAKSGNRDVQLAAVKMLSSEAVLSEIADASTIDTSVRVAATNKLSDQAVVSKLALSSGDPEVRLAATGRLTGSPTLADVYKRDSDTRVRSLAAMRINDVATAKGLLTVKIISARFLSQLNVPTGGGRIVGDGRFESTSEARRPKAGWVFLSLRIAVHTPTRSFMLSIAEATLGRGQMSTEVYTPFLWEKSVVSGLISERGNTLKMDTDNELTLVTEVPNVSPETLMLSLGGHSMGSLESLGMKIQK